MCILFKFSMLWAIYIFWINPTEKKKFLLQWQSVGFFFSPIYCPPGEMAVRFLGKVIKHLSWTSHMIWRITHFRSTNGAGWIMCKMLRHGGSLFKQLTLSISIRVLAIINVFSCTKYADKHKWAHYKIPAMQEKCAHEILKSIFFFFVSLNVKTSIDMNTF